MDSYRYILITPVKNEIKNIDNLVKSVVNQTVVPLIWVIVDDNSSDGSKEKLERYARKYNFMKVVTYPKKEKYDVEFHYSEVVGYGLDFIIKYCNEKNVTYNYIGLLDADITLERDYFKKLINNFEKDPKLGILSGRIYSWNGKKYVIETKKDNLPRGGARMFRKSCFQEIGGIPVTYSSDTVSNIKALMHGWKIGKIKDAIAYQSRMTSSTQGTYIGWKRRGVSSYYLYVSPMVVIYTFINLIIHRNIKAGMGYLDGYILSFLKRKKKINDEDVIKYNRNYIQKKISCFLKRYFHLSLSGDK